MFHPSINLLLKLDEEKHHIWIRKSPGNGSTEIKEELKMYCMCSCVRNSRGKEGLVQVDRFWSSCLGMVCLYLLPRSPTTQSTVILIQWSLPITNPHALHWHWSVSKCTANTYTRQIQYQPVTWPTAGSGYKLTIDILYISPTIFITRCINSHYISLVRHQHSIQLSYTACALNDYQSHNYNTQTGLPNY